MKKRKYTKKSDFWHKSCKPLSVFSIEFVKKFYPQKGGVYCANILKCSNNEIHRIVSHLDIKRIWRKTDPDVYKNINSPHFAYLLGLLWADGHITPNKYEIALSLVKNDGEIVLNSLTKDCPFHFKEKRFKKNGRASIIFRISDSGFHSFLTENDYIIKSGASADKILSKIPEHLKHYWWRGYNDGDGWFTVADRGVVTHGIVGCYNQNWCFANRLYESLGMKTKNIVKRVIRKSGHKCSLVILSNRADIVRFGDYIYQGYEEDQIGLKRKWIKYQKIHSKNQRHRSSIYKHVFYDKTIDKWVFQKVSGNKRLIRKSFATECEAYQASLVYLDKTVFQ